jgi:hypothetical protein
MTWLYNSSFSATCGLLLWIIPAEISDTRTRAKGVSIATMTSSPQHHHRLGRPHRHGRRSAGLLFVICNFANALFWALLPKTKKLPLEEINYLFAHAPWIVSGMHLAGYRADLEGNLERRGREFGEETRVTAEHEERADTTGM